MKNHKESNWLNLFGGFKFWEWGEFDNWVEDWQKGQGKYQCKERKATY